MQLWNQRRLPELAVDGPTGRCCSLDDVYDARHVAQHLGIPYYVVNFEQRFEQQVVKPFIDEYLAGRTPIPCTLCNNFIKFDQFLEMAEGVGAERIATGHYARIAWNPDSGRWEMRRSADRAKDQTYFLFGLTQEQLARTMFPLGGFEKPRCANWRASWAFRPRKSPTARRFASCRMAITRHLSTPIFASREFHRPRLAGELVTADGRVVGEHRGRASFHGRPAPRTAASPRASRSTSSRPSLRRERVIIGRSDALLRGSMHVKDVNWISIAPPLEPVRAEVKIRNKHAAAAATITPSSDPSRVEVRFDEPQRAVTPGQGAVFYSGDLVLGGGWIE